MKNSHIIDQNDELQCNGCFEKLDWSPTKEKTMQKKQMLRPMLGIYQKMSEPNSINRNVNGIVMAVENISESI